MSETWTTVNEATTPLSVNSDQLTAPLLERMDPAIGEASSVMGAMVTELIRRSLRGGVLHIGQELDTFVAERVTVTLQEKTPLLEQRTCELADHTARAAATEVAREEVGVLEQKTRAGQERLEVRIEEAARAAQEQTTEVARGLTGRIAEVEQHAADGTVQASRDLTARIEETEKRVTELTRAEVTQLINDMRERSRKGVEMLRERIRGVETT